MYMHGFKCQVTGATSTVPVAPAKPPVHCADNPNTCVQGAKQMIAWNRKRPSWLLNLEDPDKNLQKRLVTTSTSIFPIRRDIIVVVDGLLVRNVSEIEDFLD